MNTEQWGEIVSHLDLTGTVLENIPTEITEDTDEETILNILKQTTQMDQRTWVLQAFILYYIHDRAPLKRKTAELIAAAKEVGIGRTLAFDLRKIYEVFLLDDITLPQLPGLTKNHFISAIRNYDSCVERGVNIVDLLKEASDSSWTSDQFNSFVKEGTIKIKRVMWYKVLAGLRDEPNEKWIKESISLNKQTKMFVSETNDIYLQITQYEEP